MKLQQAQLSHRESSHVVIEQLHSIIDLLEVHAHHEDHIFNEPLEKLNPAVATLFEKEHEEDHRLASVLRNQLEEWNNSVTEEARSKAGLHLFYSFNEFMAFNLYRMKKRRLL